MKELPVYLFTGFLEAGKTRFIQESLQDPRFCSGERTLILLCEEGLEELDATAFASTDVWVERIENEADIQPQNLRRLADARRCTRVLVEYNGMWMIDTLYNQMPQNWVVVQEFLFCDANTFLSYNANMRQLVYDKLRSCEIVVFNRCGPGIDKMALHKIVRAVNRRTDIAYEHPDGTAEYDDIVDPLPFDLNAPVVKIEDRDYALFYSDLTEDMKKYQGKTVSYKGQVARGPAFPKDSFMVGRQVMACCANDMSYAGLVSVWPGASSLRRGEWVQVTGKVEIRTHRVYRGEGPVLSVTKLEPAEAPQDPVATFY